MSLKAKLEAVIYAAEEPVTLNQLAALFSAEALEWKAAQEAAAREQTAEVAGEAPPPTDPLLLLNASPHSDPGSGLDASLDYLGLADTPAIYTEVKSDPAASDSAETPSGKPDQLEQASPSLPAPAVEQSTPADSVAPEPLPATDETATAPAVPEIDPDAAPVIDIEAESKRLARLRDREVKGVLRQLLDELIASSEAEGRGVEIREIAGGYRVATKPEYHDAVRLFVKSLKPAMKLSLPALETLAVVAYKQPVTAPEVNEIRGVESAGVLGSLLARKLVATAGRKQVIGRPILYKTTKEFLLRFGLKDLSELPSMEEFEKMAAMELEEPGDTEPGSPEQAVSSTELDFELEENAEAVLESNSPSGDEGADAAKEADTADAANDRGELPQTDQAQDTLRPHPETSAEPGDDGEDAAGDPAAELGSGPAADEPLHPADPPDPAQNEASHHGKEDHQEH